MGLEGQIQSPPEAIEPSLHDFMMVVRDALLMIVRWIERVYGKR